MNVFITGGSTGLGWGLAKSYLDKGHRVAIASRDCNKVPKEAERYKKLYKYNLDVCDRDTLIGVVNEFSQGKLDIIIANAGIAIEHKLDIPNFDLARKIINTNVIGVINTFEAALSIMLTNRSGHLIAVSSVSGFVGLPCVGAYSASKSAVLKMCESYAIDFKKYGINVSVIAPGFIDTPLTQKNTHRMPFLMTVDKAVSLIIPKVKKKKALIVIPRRMLLTMFFLEKIPRTIYRFCMNFYKLK
jgi:NAD(P)-dependent dehydrogenase (short-subunit alcohol dehydrogenase family)